MKLLHTADWHLGKHLEGYSRLWEQEKFIEELIDIVEDNDVDLVIISGDIYDNFNPPADAEQLFYQAIKRLSADGERVICIIAGNHDSPKRLMASYPIVSNQGIVIIGYPGTKVEPCKLGNYQIVAGGKGFFELDINDERIVVLTLAYPSESRLQQVLDNTSDERQLQKKYSETVDEIFQELEKHYREDTINIAASHLFVAGGEKTDSERPIQVGGGMTVATSHLPSKSQYTALGHLHRAQIACKEKNAYYSGSPIQYSKSEIGYAKTVNLVELHPRQEPDVKHINISNPKPIEVWEVKGVDQAIQKCKENQSRKVWAYLHIHTIQPLLQSDIKKIKELKPDLLSIVPLIAGEELDKSLNDIDDNKNIVDLFQEFYLKTRGVEPDTELLNMFTSIITDREEEVR